MKEVEYITVPAGVTITDNMSNKHVLQEAITLEVVKYGSYEEVQPGGFWICRKPPFIISGLEGCFPGLKLCVFVDDKDISCPVPIKNTENK